MTLNLSDLINGKTNYKLELNFDYFWDRYYWWIVAAIGAAIVLFFLILIIININHGSDGIL